MITPERAQQMQNNFWAESNDPTTEEWRETLTEEEAAVVKGWDALCDKGIVSLAAYTLDVMKEVTHHE